MMNADKKRRIWVCGMADALTMFFLLLLPLLLLGDPGDLRKLFTTHLLWVLLGFVPLSLLAGWRGIKDAIRLINGNHHFKQVLLEGFTWGFTVSLLFWFVGYLNEALAAGGNFDEVIGQPGNLWAWFRLLLVIIPFSAVIGGLGVLVASLLHLLNRYLLSW